MPKKLPNCYFKPRTGVLLEIVHIAPAGRRIKPLSHEVWMNGHACVCISCVCVCARACYILIYIYAAYIYDVLYLDLYIGCMYTKRGIYWFICCIYRLVSSTSPSFAVLEKTTLRLLENWVLCTIPLAVSWKEQGESEEQTVSANKYISVLL